MTKVEFENKCTFMLRRLHTMGVAEIMKMSTELSRVELNALSESDCPRCFAGVSRLSQSDYLNLFGSLRVFMMNVNLALANNKLFQLEKPHIAEEMMNTHKAFHERGVCDIVMGYTDGFAEIRDLCDELDEKLININPEIFFFLDEVAADRFGDGDPIFDGGFSGLLEDNPSTNVPEEIPFTTSDAIDHMISLIDYLPYTFFMAVIEYIVVNETDEEFDEEPNGDEIYNDYMESMAQREMLRIPQLQALDGEVEAADAGERAAYARCETSSAACPSGTNRRYAADQAMQAAEQHTQDTECQEETVQRQERRCSRHHHLSEEEIEEAVRNGARRILLCGYDCDCEVDCDCKSND